MLESYDFNLVEKFVREAISNKGITGERYNQIRICPVNKVMCSIIKNASNGKLDVTGKHWALEGTSIYHEYLRHSNPDIERSRGQIPFAVEDYVKMYQKIMNPDFVEYIAPPNNNLQRHRLALIAKDEGYVVVIEQVGGNKNPNIVPPMMLHMTEKRIEKVLHGEQSVSDLIYENDIEKMPSEEQRLMNIQNRVNVKAYYENEIEMGEYAL